MVENMQNESGITPAFNRIVVKKRIVKNQLKSGLVLPDGAKREIEKSQGEILAVGPTVRHTILDGKKEYYFNPGDKIIWGKYGGVEIKRPEGVFIIMNDEDIIGKVDDYYDEVK